MPSILRITFTVMNEGFVRSKTKFIVTLDAFKTVILSFVLYNFFEFALHFYFNERNWLQNINYAFVWM